MVDAGETCKDPAKSGALFSDKQMVVTTNASYATSVVVGDFNGDGWLDLASASYHDNKITWYKNTDGKGTFGPQIIVTTKAYGAQSVAVGDFNGDGWLDLASAFGNAVAWYKNTDGKGTFGQPIIVTTKTIFARSVAVGDFNGDGWLDLVSASANDNKIAWYKNTDGKGTFGQQIIVTTNASRALSVAVGDFNGDGWLDLASASYGDTKIAWYKNTDGKGTFGEQIVVTTKGISAISVAVGDFNGDGWLDLASASPVAWYNNTDGKGTFGEQIIVTTKAIGAMCVAVGDLNGDGWLDLVSATQWNSMIAWYKNTDGKGTFGQQIIVTTRVIDAQSVTVGDFNGDGWLDLASASDADNKIAWYQNDGPCCPPGQGSNDDVYCTSCTPGHFGPTISTPCLSCLAGFWSTGSAQVTCTGCSAGQFSSEIGLKSNDQCKGRCAAGTYSSEIGLTKNGQCKGRCAAGTYSSETGLSKSTQCHGHCSAGKYSSETRLVSDSQCQGRCSIGKFSSKVGLTSDSECLGRCSAGKYSSETGLSMDQQCQGRCPAGRFSQETGLTSSDECKGYCSAGKFSSEVGLASDEGCRGRCPAGTFSSDTGLTSKEQCVGRCSAGKFSSETGLTSESECTHQCSAGRYSSETGLTTNEECSKCPSDTYSQEEGQTSKDVCLKCPSGWSSKAQGVTTCTETAVKDQVEWIIGISAGSVFLLAAVVVFGICRSRSITKSHDHQQFQSEAERSLLQTEIAQISEGRQIEFNDLTWEKKLAAGAGGEVWKGKWRMMPEHYVAIKRIFLTNQDDKFRADDFWKNLSNRSNESNESNGTNGESKNDIISFDSVATTQTKISFLEVENVPAAADISWTLEKEISLLMRIKPHPR